MRFLNAAIFLGAAVVIGWVNSSHPDHVWYLPFEAVIKSLKGDFTTQSHLTVALFGTLGAYYLISAFVRRPNASE